MHAWTSNTLLIICRNLFWFGTLKRLGFTCECVHLFLFVTSVCYFEFPGVNLEAKHRPQSYLAS